ncbi:MAG: GAF domain-containing protein [Acidobacteria bacterium]|nr:MAG: GAF domain-containing protein [Acidobacteriota bacterium]
MAFLRIHRPKGGTYDLPLERELFSIGRGPANDLHLHNPWLSRLHAQIVARDGGHVIVDQGSRNGTYVNEQFVRREQVLRHGDEITIGDIRITYLSEEGGGLEVSEETSGLAEGTVILPSDELAFERYREAAPADLRREGASLLPALNAAASALLVHLPLEQLVEKVLDIVMQAVSAERAALLLRSAGDGELAIEAVRGYRRGDPVSISRTIIDTVLERRQAVLTVDARTDERFEQAHSILLQGIRSIICAPLWNNREVIGLIYLDHRFTGQAFNESDLRLVGLIANMAAVKIENAQLLAAQLEQERLEQQMAVGAQIQRKLLPDGDPEVPGYQICGVNRSCFAIGGDYYDFIAKRDGKQAIVVADLSGKGIGAALLMAVLQASLRALIEGAEEPAALVDRLNHVLITNSPYNKFATIFYAELDPRSHVLQYVNGGHNPGLLRRAGGAIEMLEPCGPIVGMIEEATFSCRQVSLEPGDTLLLYTDGVTELTDEEDAEFGYERLVELVAREPVEEASSLIDAVQVAMRAFSPRDQPDDDCTLVVVRRCS